MPKSKIERELFGRPQSRAKLEALALDPGASINTIEKAVRAAGIKASRSAAARWMLNVRRDQSGSRSAAMAAAIRGVIELDDDGLKWLANTLRRRCRERR